MRMSGVILGPREAQAVAMGHARRQAEQHKRSLDG
jgi:hypothetical protein